MTKSVTFRKFALKGDTSDSVSITELLNVSWQDRTIILSPHGEDGKPDLTREEAVELADLMIDRWQKFKARNSRPPDGPKD